MKIFVSSLITGMGDLRKSARQGIVDLDHEPLMAEDFGAQPRSAQIACLDGVRKSAAIVLILGAQYGVKQDSGLSANWTRGRFGTKSRALHCLVMLPCSTRASVWSSPSKMAP
jgi:hypothetical protein